MVRARGSVLPQEHDERAPLRVELGAKMAGEELRAKMAGEELRVQCCGCEPLKFALACTLSLEYTSSLK